MAKRTPISARVSADLANHVLDGLRAGAQDGKWRTASEVGALVGPMKYHMTQAMPWGLGYGSPPVDVPLSRKDVRSALRLLKGYGYVEQHGKRDHWRLAMAPNPKIAGSKREALRHWGEPKKERVHKPTIVGKTVRHRGFIITPYYSHDRQEWRAEIEPDDEDLQKAQKRAQQMYPPASEGQGPSEAAAVRLAKAMINGDWGRIVDIHELDDFIPEDNPKARKKKRFVVVLTQDYIDAPPGPMLRKLYKKHGQKKPRPGDEFQLVYLDRKGDIIKKDIYVVPPRRSIQRGSQPKKKPKKNPRSVIKSYLKGL